MTAIVWSDATSFCTADAATLNAVPPVIQTAILAQVNNMLDVTRFDAGEADPRLYMCRCNLVGHFVMSNAFGAFGAAAGAVTQESAGTYSRQYANAFSGSSSPYASTSYGRQYLTLIRMLGGGFAMSGAYVFPPPFPGDCQ